MSSPKSETALFSPTVPLNASPTPTRSPMMFLNIPISNLAASTAFYTALGFIPNKTFADPTSIMMSLPPLYPSSQLPHTSADNRCGTINLMIMTKERFEGFLPKKAEHKREVVDARGAAQALFCLSCGSPEEVDQWVQRAVEAGGKGEVCEKNNVEMDLSAGGCPAGEKDGAEGEKKGEAGGKGEGKKELMMYGNSFEDPDGHIWELVWMDTRFSAGPPS